MTSVAQLIESIHGRFEAAGLHFGHGTDNAWDEAVALVLTMVGLPDDERSLAEEVAVDRCRAIDMAATQRIDTRQPLAYVLGKTQYAGFEFYVEPGVMVPRSPIGLLLQDRLVPYLATAPARVLDLCSGGGCLGIIAAHCYPDAIVVLVEADTDACHNARRNIEAHGLNDRVELVEGDVLGYLDTPAAVNFDLVITNPPYVGAQAMAELPPEFRAEPAHGLAAGRDGLALIGPILRKLRRTLSANGVCVGEVGETQAALAAAFPQLPFVWLELPMGGAGVFVLEARGLNSDTAPLI